MDRPHSRLVAVEPVLPASLRERFGDPRQVSSPMGWHRSPGDQRIWSVTA